MAQLPHWSSLLAALPLDEDIDELEKEKTVLVLKMHPGMVRSLVDVEGEVHKDLLKLSLLDCGRPKSSYSDKSHRSWGVEA